MAKYQVFANPNRMPAVCDIAHRGPHVVTVYGTAHLFVGKKYRLTTLQHASHYDTDSH